MTGPPPGVLQVAI